MFARSGKCHIQAVSSRREHEDVAIKCDQFLAIKCDQFLAIKCDQFKEIIFSQ